MSEQRLLILDIGVRIIFHTALVFSLFLLFSGHNSPGGGFTGGLVAGAALVLRAMSGPGTELRYFERIPPEILLGAGLLVAGGTGFVAWIMGGDFLESGEYDLHAPVLGEVHFTSVLEFDIGVYLVVLGLVATIIERLAEKETP